jgi:hypothetical protein
MYRFHVLAIFAVIFFGAHVINGAIECHTTFCPGDRESDWVYEYTDDDGKRMIVIDGKPLDKELWKKHLGIDKLKVEQ